MDLRSNVQKFIYNEVHEEHEAIIKPLELYFSRLS